MNRALSSLSAAIASGLERQSERSGDVGLSALPSLKRASSELSRRFDQVEKALAPPREKRLLALGKFKREQALTSSEWRLVFAGLADDDEVSVPVLEDDQLFDRVHREVAGRIEQRSLSRRDWLALCFSYFAYDEHKPDDNANWRVLRDDIDRGFDAVRQRIGREKEWMRIVAEHRELFGAQAGTRLAEEIFEGRARDLSSLQAIAQVPDGSWLWQRIFAVLLSRIFLLDDETFLKRLPELVALGQLNTRYLNQVLSACLTRYHRSRYREQSSSLLKQAALEHWGSPQMRSKQNAWLQYVEQPVCAMVVAWFAKEDLEHFFTLLKGEAEVDQSRLFYWLRFTNQMSYTRIVMGSDAWHDRSSDFVAFREKNKGRLSQLTGGSSHINAVVMQIGSYFFVEFSGTGHACYVYRADRLPFNPDQQVLGLNTELKQKGHKPAPMRHSPAPRRPNVVEGWLEKFDDELRALGIIAQRPASYMQPRGSEDKPAAHSAASAPVAGDSLDVQVKSMLGSVPYKTFDHRSTSGVYQVLLARDDAAAKTALLRLGFKAVKNNALMFWRL
ncbi:EH signature domain-containing protein [Pseudomonas guariconensis]|uniref:type I Zorya anti-phage system protein ZorC n=1 Tax=Pseudomonas TaxID=286 RepID=UPI0020976E26|nr:MULTISPECIES: type I Zorya anti-phage system protein ZorC [Pseudomonas]MCO7517868.1 EH signature domain-containing protein [Pseudomonas putida]MCO7608371.1 EH signature domain-containing protein [Pseudomonas guariconensis]